MKQATLKELYEGRSPLLNYDFDTDVAVEHLNTRGMFVLRGLLSTELVEALKLEGRNLHRESTKFARDTYSGDSGNSYRINVALTRLQKNDKYLNASSIKTVIDHPKFRYLVDTALSSKSGVSNYIYDYSTIDSGKERKDADLFPLHYDWRDHCRCIKIYIYLSDVGVEQGAIRYIPYSHQLVRYLWRNKTSEMQQQWDKCKGTGISRNSLENLLTSVSPDIENNYPINETIEILKSISNAREKSYQFAVTGNPGDVLVFDENGIHGGGPINNGYRYICRAHFVDRKYVNRLLPDQQTRIMRYLVSPFRRRIRSCLNLPL